MRNFLLVVCLLAGFSALAQKEDKKIKGSGNVITKDVSVQPFTDLEASGVFSVSLIQGDKEHVKIEAEDNLQELFQVRNEGTKLVIEMKKNMNIDTKKGMKVYITFKNLKSMDLSMVGGLSSVDKLSFSDLRIDNSCVGSLNLDLTAQKLNIENNSVGSVTLSGKAENAVIKHNGVGSLKASNLLVQTMDIESNGIGSAEVNAEKELKVKDSFLGKVRNSGKATTRRMNKVVI